MDTPATLLDLTGRRALVTGAAAGIGRAIALLFASAGADLLLVDRDEQGIEALAAELRALGRSVDTLPADLGDASAIDAIWARIDTEGSLPDTLVNNAGIYPFRDFLDIDAEFLRKVSAVNMESALWMCQHFIRRRQRAGGVIINVSSIEALLPFTEHLAVYSMSKAGVIALTRSLARDYGRRQFRVNGILPGAIRTQGTERLMRDAILRPRVKSFRTGIDFQSRLPAGHWGRPEDVARVALFLASDLSSYIYGAMIPVDGGFLSA